MPELATVTAIGDLVCPNCWASIVTPTGVNPHSGRYEKMILIAGGDTVCRCGITFTVNDAEAKRHNHYWFPEDPKYKGESC